MPIAIRPLSPTLGAELQGFDPRNPDADAVQALRRTFDEKHLVLVRGVELSEDESVALATHLGEISHAGDTMKGNKRFTYISNVAADGRLPDGELLFHADHMFMPHPLKAISLYAMAVPSTGGETCFIDTAAAYDALPDAVKARLQGLQARHVYDYSANTGNRPPSRDTIAEGATTAVHPVVTVHPATGKKVLFVCRLFTVAILGLPREQSDELLDFLFDHLDAHATDYEHKWAVNDFLIWDNRILQHARNDFPSTEKRHMRRVPIASETVSA